MVSPPPGALGKQGTAAHEDEERFAGGGATAEPSFFPRRASLRARPRSAPSLPPAPPPLFWGKRPPHPLCRPGQVARGWGEPRRSRAAPLRGPRLHSCCGAAAVPTRRARQARRQPARPPHGNKARARRPAPKGGSGRLGLRGPPPRDPLRRRPRGCAPRRAGAGR